MVVINGDEQWKYSLENLCFDKCNGRECVTLEQDDGKGFASCGNSFARHSCMRR